MPISETETRRKKRPERRRRVQGFTLLELLVVLAIAALIALVGVVVGEISAVLGLVASFQLDVPPGPAIVFLALAWILVPVALWVLFFNVRG